MKAKKINLYGNRIDLVGEVDVDTTLTQEGQAADSKAVGDKIGEISQSKLDKPESGAETGKVLKIKSVNEDGTFACEWADESGGGAVDTVARQEVQKIKSAMQSNNLAGSKSGVLYPCEIPTRTSVTVSSFDGTAFNLAFRILLYDENKTQVDYWTIQGGTTGRTFTTPTGTVIRYIGWSDDPSVTVMVNIGSTALSYEPYIFTPREVTDKLNDLQIDLGYVTPEMYGAVGNGYTDDTNAIVACINNAKIKHIPVRGFGRYVINETIAIECNESWDIYFNYLKYTGSSIALDLKASYLKLTIGNMLALSNSAVAIKLRDCAVGCCGNVIDIHYLYSGSHCFEFDASNANILYNQFYLYRLRSENGNVFNVSGSHIINENSFYGKSIKAENGWFIYNNYQNIKHIGRFYDFCIEGDVMAGVYNSTASLVNCRTREMIDQKKNDGTDRGLLYKFVSVEPFGKLGDNTEADYTSIDNSGCMSFDDMIAQCERKVDSGELSSNTDILGQLTENIYSYAENDFCARIAGDEYADGSQKYSVGGKIILYWGNKGFVPNKEWYHKITESVYRTIETDWCTPTVFDIDIARTEIYLDASYCGIGITDFEVRQSDGKFAKIFDKNGNLIFDGAIHGDGIYTLHCDLKQLDEIVVQGSNKTFRLSGSYISHIYTGNNEAWSLKKIGDIIDAPTKQLELISETTMETDGIFSLDLTQEKEMLIVLFEYSGFESGKTISFLITFSDDNKACFFTSARVGNSYGYVFCDVRKNNFALNQGLTAADTTSSINLYSTTYDSIKNAINASLNGYKITKVSTTIPLTKGSKVIVYGL